MERGENILTSKNPKERGTHLVVDIICRPISTGGLLEKLSELHGSEVRAWPLQKNVIRTEVQPTALFALRPHREEASGRTIPYTDVCATLLRGAGADSSSLLLGDCKTNPYLTKILTDQVYVRIRR